MDLAVIDDPAAAVAALDPVRRRVLAALSEPGSATTVATSLGLPRQQINYHLRTLEHHGLVRMIEERPRRGLTERVMQATARGLRRVAGRAGGERRRRGFGRPALGTSPHRRRGTHDVRGRAVGGGGRRGRSAARDAVHRHGDQVRVGGGSRGVHQRARRRDDLARREVPRRTCSARALAPHHRRSTPTRRHGPARSGGWT